MDAQGEKTSMENGETSNSVNTANHFSSRTRLQHNCSKCCKAFKYTKSFEKHILVCKGSSAIPVQLEAQFDQPQGAQANSQRYEIVAPMDEASPTFYTNNQEPLQSYDSTVASTEVHVGNFIIIDKMETKKTDECDVKSTSESTLDKFELGGPTANNLNQAANNLDIKEENFSDHEVRIESPETVNQQNLNIKMEEEEVEEFQDIDEESETTTTLSQDCDPRFDSLSFSSHMDIQGSCNESIDFIASETPQDDTAHSRVRRKSKCKNFDKTLPTLLDLEMPNRQHPCSECEATFVSFSGLKQHMKTHSEFECDICERTFTQKATLVDHRNNHLGIRPYKCSFCTQAFSSRQVLSYHRRTQHNTELRRRDYARNNSGNHVVEDHHMNANEAVGNNLCDEMEFLGENEASTSSHPYVCPTCPCTYADPKNLRSHLNTHTNLFKCEVCNMRFQNQNALRGHMKVHTRLEQQQLLHYHLCKICNRWFSTLQGLRCHNTLLHSPQSQPHKSNEAFGNHNRNLTKDKEKSPCDELELLDSNETHNAEENRSAKCVKEKHKTGENHVIGHPTASAAPVIEIEEHNPSPAPNHFHANDDVRYKTIEMVESVGQKFIIIDLGNGDTEEIEADSFHYPSQQELQMPHGAIDPHPQEPALIKKRKLAVERARRYRARQKQLQEETRMQSLQNQMSQGTRNLNVLNVDDRREGIQCSTVTCHNESASPDSLSNNKYNNSLLKNRMSAANRMRRHRATKRQLQEERCLDYNALMRKRKCTSERVREFRVRKKLGEENLIQSLQNMVQQNNGRCDLCDVAFPDPSLLEDHLLTHKEFMAIKNKYKMPHDAMDPHHQEIALLRKRKLAVERVRRYRARQKQLQEETRMQSLQNPKTKAEKNQVEYYKTDNSVNVGHIEGRTQHTVCFDYEQEFKPIFCASGEVSAVGTCYSETSCTNVIASEQTEPETCTKAGNDMDGCVQAVKIEMSHEAHDMNKLGEEATSERMQCSAVPASDFNERKSEDSLRNDRNENALIKKRENIAQYMREYRARKSQLRKERLLENPSNNNESTLIRNRKSSAERMRKHQDRKRQLREERRIHSLQVQMSHGAGGSNKLNDEASRERMQGSAVSGPELDKRESQDSLSNDTNHNALTKKRAQYMREYRARKRHLREQKRLQSLQSEMSHGAHDATKLNEEGGSESKQCSAVSAADLNERESEDSLRNDKKENELIKKRERTAQYMREYRARKSQLRKERRLIKKRKSSAERMRQYRARKRQLREEKRVQNLHTQKTETEKTEVTSIKTENTTSEDVGTLNSEASTGSVITSTQTEAEKDTNVRNEEVKASAHVVKNEMSHEVHDINKSDEEASRERLQCSAVSAADLNKRQSEDYLRNDRNQSALIKKRERTAQYMRKYRARKSQLRKERRLESLSNNIESTLIRNRIASADRMRNHRARKRQLREERCIQSLQIQMSHEAHDMNKFAEEGGSDRIQCSTVAVGELNERESEDYLKNDKNENALIKKRERNAQYMREYRARKSQLRKERCLESPSNNNEIILIRNKKASEERMRKYRDRKRQLREERQIDRLQIEKTTGERYQVTVFKTENSSSEAETMELWDAVNAQDNELKDAVCFVEPEFKPIFSALDEVPSLGTRNSRAINPTEPENHKKAEDDEDGTSAQVVKIEMSHVAGNERMQCSAVAATAKKSKDSPSNDDNEKALIKKRKSAVERMRRYRARKKQLREEKLKLSVQNKVEQSNERCDFCDAIFAEPFLLEAHRNRHLEVKNQRSTQCHFCFKVYKSLDAVRSHLVTHTSRYKCEYCKKTFQCGRKLEDHIRRHLNIKLHQCTVCKAFFGSPSELTKHMKIHSRMAYKCDVCGREFTTQTALEDHKNLHLGIKPHKCIFCTKAFATPRGLMLHYNSNHNSQLQKVGSSNSNELADQSSSPNKDNMKKACEDVGEHDEASQPAPAIDLGALFACSICSKVYSTRSGLNMHLLVHTERFKCEHCGKTTQTGANLKLHIATHFKVKKKSEPTVQSEIDDEGDFKTTVLQNDVNIVEMEAQDNLLKDAICFDEEQEFKFTVENSDKATCEQINYPVTEVESRSAANLIQHQNVSSATVDANPSVCVVKIER